METKKVDSWKKLVQPIHKSYKSLKECLHLAAQHDISIKEPVIVKTKQ